MKDELIDKLGDVWSHVGTARDNGEPIDADDIQTKMIECRQLIEAERARTPRTMWMIVGVDRGDGHHRLDTSGMQVYLRPEVAREDLNRFLFKVGYGVVELEVKNSPHLLGTKEQQEAWEAKEKK